MPHLIVIPWPVPHPHSNPLLFFKAQIHFQRGFLGWILFLQEWAYLLSFSSLKLAIFFPFFLPEF